MLFRICAVLCNFYPRPPRGGRLKPYFQKSCDFEFLSTPSARRATRGMRRYCCPRTYFYPRPPRGGRPGIRPALSALRYFYPRPPRGGRPLYGAARQGVRGISIHALREEGDGVQVSRCHLLGNFYPRPPRGGRRDTKAAFAPSHEFLSTPSARRATRQMELFEEMEEFLSTPSARRATSRVLISCVRTGNFYPRPPRGGRPLLSLPSFALMLFLSTPSARRATAITRHLLRSRRNFYPRPPRGGRLTFFRVSPMPTRFLSTPSARRATAKTETKSLFSNKLYNILHEFRRALIYNGSKSYPNHAK